MGKILLYVLAICLFTAGFILGYLGQSVSSSAFVIAALVTVFICNIDKLSEFKVANISATIKKAENTLSELQLLAAELCSASLWSLKARMFIGDYDEAREELYNRQIEMLKQLKIPEDKIKEIEDGWHSYVEYTYTIAIIENARGLTARIDKMANLTEFDKEKKRFYNQNFTPTPVAELKYFLEKYNTFNAKMAEYLEAYEHYTKNHIHKSKELWLERKKWVLS